MMEKLGSGHREEASSGSTAKLSPSYVSVPQRLRESFEEFESGEHRFGGLN